VTRRANIQKYLTNDKVKGILDACNEFMFQKL